MHSFSNGTSIQTKLGNWQQLERVSQRDMNLTSQSQSTSVQLILQFIDGSGLCSEELTITVASVASNLEKRISTESFLPLLSQNPLQELRSRASVVIVNYKSLISHSYNPLPDLSFKAPTSCPD